MRFKKKLHYRTVVPGIIIVLLALLSTHTTSIPLLWSGVLMSFGIVLFFNGFLEHRKEPKRVRLINKKLNNKLPTNLQYGDKV
jgi:hypothetical protein